MQKNHSWSYLSVEEFLFANGTFPLFQEPLPYALKVEKVLAGQFQNFFSLFNTVTADRARFFETHVIGGGHLSHLLLSQPLRNIPHFFLQFQELLVGHGIGVDFKPILIAHTHDHVTQVFHVHGTDLFI